MGVHRKCLASLCQCMLLYVDRKYALRENHMLLRNQLDQSSTYTVVLGSLIMLSPGKFEHAIKQRTRNMERVLA